MRRRGFLSFMGLAGGAAASGTAVGMLPANENAKGVYVPLKCGNRECASEWKLFVDLTGPITLGSPQCPRCLHVMAFPEDASQIIKRWNLAHGAKTTIYTPRFG